MRALTARAPPGPRHNTIVMHKFLLAIGLFLCLQSIGQLPTDVLRYSWTVPGGTAREQAIGGAMGSLGGDITSAFVNPAGLGLYKTSEVVLSPGWRFLKDQGNYLGTGTKAPAINRFTVGASGAVFGYGGRDPGVSNAFAIAVNRTADFNSHVSYQGINTYSSYSEQYVEEFAASGLDINAGISSPSLDYGTRMALYTSLIDTATMGGILQVIGQPQKSGRLLQQNDLRSSGGITEIDLSLATCQHDKWYFGVSLGIPILSYTRQQTFTESDASGNPNNDFESFTYRETYTTKGSGANAKLGFIWSPSTPWRVGLAIHTPSIYGLTDHINASMITRTENYTSLKQVSISSDSLDQITGVSPQPNSVTYDLSTPWHFLISGSYIFGSGEANTSKQKGFITADLEYVTTHNPHYSVPSDQDQTGASDYYDQVNQAVKQLYKGTYSARIGGEMKFNTFLVRAGGAYYSNPYAQSGLKVDRLYLSGGLGYRSKAFFADLTYVQRLSRDIDVPYLLADKENSYASLKESGGTLLFTIGMKW